MNLYWIKTNRIIKKIFSNYTWDIPNTENKVYLTFDDGPIPEITEWVLEELKTHNAKATFFCIGDNINKNNKIFKKVITEGHAIGNHTFNHLNGWKTTTEAYLENFKRCEEIIQQSGINLKSKFFRPPYGKIKTTQAKEISKLGYKIIMWDVLSADFDQNLSKEDCLENVLSNIESGSIIVFHDSIKAFKNLEYVLPRTLAYLKENNFICDVIE
ncbi:polysaccharide deacetylase family protein [Flavobacterium gawalongense]|uniref:Polysaccharide deacetylase family protein n=1 Tax=Flavobacterium gawalongense TaxID=2594432 RepID=A0A553BWX0_9FLAO|nr:polysaccharide deacetylase family protein [Flavobacterium gawalongense]TRX04184.1 polysaccharide deacetylase family protein [Flavobacterium gawalongense]TRX09366.1 polysaccharide deacetylase family protein [Flavobacterium gawalongense]TRX12820.1 polysaccharide deacetylase family protein [Flavobacterium gawalongense]TRX13165.1 polysaccharide deacetylase family protein [Flavobacterium gawalongense]TRX30773.1 polysaccharide deacetylase family protein [Flavobacterium gawalongense]